MAGDLSYAQLKAVWLDAAKGTKYHTNMWASLMAAIAEAESAGDPLATNVGEQTSWGLWQISLGNHDQPSPAWATPSVNAKLAIGKLEGQGLGAWATYTSGAYKAFLSDKTAPNPVGTGGPSAVETAAAGNAGNASATCAWQLSFVNPIPSGVPLIGGGTSAFCLLSKSQARALMGAALLNGGLLAVWLGLTVIVAGAAVPAAERAVGGAESAKGMAGRVRRLGAKPKKAAKPKAPARS